MKDTTMQIFALVFITSIVIGYSIGQLGESQSNQKTGGQEYIYSNEYCQTFYADENNQLQLK